MNIPSSSGHRGLRSIVSSKTQEYELTRQSHGTGAMGGTKTESPVTANMWVGSPQEIAEDTELGERLTGMLAGLCLPTEDVEEGDRLTYQSVLYEVEETIISDSDTADTLQAVNLVRVQE